MISLATAARAAALGAVLLSSNLVVAIPSYGCGDDGLPKPVEWKPKPGESKLFRVNDRDVQVTVPNNYNKSNPAPMILAFHDREQSKEYFEYEGAFYDAVLNPDAIMVFPTAEEDRWLGDSTPIKKKDESEDEPSVGDKKSKKKSKAKKKKAEKHPGDQDIKFVSDLLSDLENLVCIDTSQIYATGMGTGGGMMHMLACDKELSTKFAAFGAVSGAFGRAKAGKGIWGHCEPGRKKIPIAEIHGMDDRINPYYLREGENGKIRTIPPHWIEDWAERNECGEPTRDPKISADDDLTFVTKLDNGYMTETVESGGSAIRIARKCFARTPWDETGIGLEENSETQAGDEKKMPTRALADAETTILHYQIKFYGHGWPRQQLIHHKELAFKNQLVKPPNEPFFDATKVILNFFKSHRLPEIYAGRAEIIPEDILAEQQAASKLKFSNAKKATKAKDESAMEEKLRKFQEAQEKIQAAGDVASGEKKKRKRKKKKPGVEDTTDEKDEL